ncbi:unnamed protein product [Pylaiella littoralis]
MCNKQHIMTTAEVLLRVCSVSERSLLSHIAVVSCSCYLAIASWLLRRLFGCYGAWEAVESSLPPRLSPASPHTSTGPPPATRPLIQQADLQGWSCGSLPEERRGQDPRQGHMASRRHRFATGGLLHATRRGGVG